MSDETVRVLDQNGNNTDKVASRTSVHNDEIWHEAVHIWVINEKGEVLLQKRAKNKKLYANVWHISVAGHVSSEETPLSTAIREVAEELGVKVVDTDLLYVCKLKISQVVPETGFEDREFLTIYLLKVDSGSKFNIQVEEVKEVRWISFDHFKDEIVDPIKSKNYLNHPSEYYLQTIAKIQQLSPNIN